MVLVTIVVVVVVVASLLLVTVVAVVAAAVVAAELPGRPRVPCTHSVCLHSIAADGTSCQQRRSRGLTDIMLLVPERMRHA